MSSMHNAQELNVKDGLFFPLYFKSIKVAPPPISRTICALSYTLLPFLPSGRRICPRLVLSHLSAPFQGQHFEFEVYDFRHFYQERFQFSSCSLNCLASFPA